MVFLGTRAPEVNILANLAEDCIQKLCDVVAFLFNIRFVALFASEIKTEAEASPETSPLSQHCQALIAACMESNWLAVEGSPGGVSLKTKCPERLARELRFKVARHEK